MNIEIRFIFTCWVGFLYIFCPFKGNTEMTLYQASGSGQSSEPSMDKTFLVRIAICMNVTQML